ncbi:uncharacterized protein LOC111616133 [Centruroides sculpturatus]|nr:uncharacterized protein LOC111616133 [Centruroides sculpturatus]
MSKNSPKISSPKHKNVPEENEAYSSGVLQTVKDRFSEERLARDFSSLYKTVTDFIPKQSQISQDILLKYKTVQSPHVKDDVLANFYKQCLKPLQFETWDMEVDGPFGHYYAFVRQHDRTIEKQNISEKQFWLIQPLCKIQESLDLLTFLALTPLRVHSELETSSTKSLWHRSSHLWLKLGMPDSVQRRS